MAGKKHKVVYQEFGQPHPTATQRAVRDLPPQQQDLRVQASRQGRKGKTVTEVRGFQHSPDTLKEILKKLKSQCGTGGTAKQDTLEIQGDHREKLVELLVQMGYRVKLSGG